MPTPSRRSPDRTSALIVALLTGALCACRAPNPDSTVGADVTVPEDPPHDTFEDTSAGASPPGVTLTTDSPTDLGVQVLDETGAPVEGASVTVEGRSAVTDAEGNARISGLAPSSEARVVHIARDGYATLVRRIEADASGSLGMSGALTTLQDLGWFDATADNALDLDDFSITLDAHSLVDASGAVYTGQIHAQYATWATHGESDPSLARSPGPLLAEDETNAGELDALESFGMFQIELSDDAGLPLFLGEGQRAGVSLTVPGEGDTGDDLDPSEAAWWSLDEQAGLWVPVCGDGEPEDGAECSSEAVEGGVRLSALVPHFSKYNVDLRRTRGCASVSADLDASLLPGAVFGISGPGYDLRLPAGDGTLDLVAMPRGAMSATLYLYDRAVATGTVKPAELGDGACSASLTLRPSPDRRGSATGGGGMVVRARSGTCPASGGTVRVSRGGSTVLTGSMAEAMTWIDDLPEGTYSVSLVNTLGQVQDSAELTLSAGVEAPALLTLEAPASWAKVPPGGCVDLPCEGDACDSCAQMEVTEGGVPVAELAVSLDSDSEPTFTDDEGQVCRDLEGLADQRLLVSLPDGTLGSGTLPRSGSCEAGSCLSIPLEVGAGRSCPAGTEAWSATSAWLGALNPGFLDDRTVVPPTPIEGGGLWLSMRVEGDDDGELQAVLEKLLDDAEVIEDADGERVEGWVSGQSWAWEALEQDALGDLRSAGLRLRAGEATVGMEGRSLRQGLAMNLSTSRARLRQGRSAETAETKLWDDGYGLPLQLEEGEGEGKVSYDGVEGGALVFSLDGTTFTMDDARYTSAKIHVEQGRWIAPLLDASRVPEGWSWTEARPLAGAWGRVQAEGSDRGFGTSQVDGGAGALDICVPSSGRFALTGTPVAGAMRPFGPLLVWRRGQPTLAGNDTAGRTWLANPDLVWVDSATVEAAARAQGLPVARLGEQASVFGVAQRCDTLGCEAVTEGIVRIDPPGAGCAPVSVSVTPDQEEPGVFALVGIDPTCASLSRPYTLSLWGADGAEITSFRQLVVPVAGGAMVVPSRLGSLRYADVDGDGYGDADAPTYGAVGAGWSRTTGDCDDAATTVHPGAEETCDGVDDDCDGEVDEADASDATTWYLDEDADGYGDDEVSVRACGAPEGYADTGGDCDDGDPGINPGATEDDCADPTDYNCDGSVGYADDDGDGYAACEECDDADPDVSMLTWYFDGDGDGFGDAFTSATSCDAPDSYVADNTDCDDADASVYPGATESCDGVDHDCDGTVDEDDASDAPTWFADADGDGYGDHSTTAISCDMPDGYVDDDTDCDDTDPYVYPSAPELCDDQPNDCTSTTLSSDDESEVASFKAADGTWTEVSLGHRTEISEAGELYICEGTYSGATIYVNRNAGDVAIIGRGSDLTTLDASELDPVIYTKECVNLTVTGLTATNGLYHSGGGIYVTGGRGSCLDELTLEDVIITHNSATYVGGGIYVNDDAIVTMTEVTLSDNHTTYYPGGTAGYYGGGGAKLITNYPIRIEDSIISDNSSAGFGGGINLSSDGDLTMIDVELSGNDADMAGGGLWAFTDTALQVAGGEVSLNTAGTYGGGLSMGSGSLTLDDVLVSENTSVEEGGGIYFKYSSATDSMLSISSSTLERNKASVGGGIFAYGAVELNLTNTSITDNEADAHDGLGGGMYLYELSGSSTCTGDGMGSFAISGNHSAAVDDIWMRLAEDGTWTASDCPSADVWNYSHGAGGWAAFTVPGATWSCDSDGCTCDDSPVVGYADADGDGFGDGDASYSSCDEVDVVADDADCDDTDVSVNPGEAEVCDSKDNNCDGAIDEGAPKWYSDADGDGYGDPDSSVSTCTAPDGYVDDDTDCDDANAYVYPEAPELCDEQLNDCDAAYPSDLEEGVASFEADDGTWSVIDLSEETSLWDAGTLWICPGEYDDVNLIAKVSGLSVRSTGDASDTTLRPLYGGPAIKVAHHASLEVEGLTITGGNGWDNGGAVEVEYLGTLYMADSVVTANEVSLVGGGIFIDRKSSVEIDRVEISHNTTTFESYAAQYNGGAGLKIMSGSTVTIRDSSIHHNDSASYGGGINLDEGVTLNLENVDIYENAAAYGGGGVYDYGWRSDSLATESQVTVTGGEISDNVAGTNGGGISLRKGCNWTITNVQILKNEAGEDGGGIYAPYSTLIISDSEISSNEADPDDGLGGGIFLYEISEGTACSGPGDGTFTISDNTASQGADLWMHFADGGTWTASDCPSAEVYNYAEGAGEVSAFTEPGADWSCDMEGCTCEASSIVYYADEDGDGFGDPDAVAPSCDGGEPAGSVDDASDCDDENETVFPDADEICGDGVVNDCSSSAEEDSPSCRYTGSTSLPDAGTMFIGEESGDLAGRDVAAAGDTNGDGFDDLLIGAVQSEGKGAVYVVQGPVTGSTYNLSDATAKLTGETTGDIAGYFIAGAGDVNGDGYDDILAGAPYNDDAAPDSGATYLQLGPFSGSGALSEGATTFTGTNSGDEAGESIARAGTVFGDDVNYLLIGAELDEGGINTGGAYLVDEDSLGGSLADVATAVLLGESSYDHAGVSLSGGHDVDGDGFDDLFVGAYQDDDGGLQAGAAYVVYGPVPDPFYLGDAGSKLIGDAVEDRVGFPIKMVGDVDADGYDDLLLGVQLRDDVDTNAGVTYLVRGASTAWGTASLSSKASATFFGQEAGGYAGHSVDVAGDVDGDGDQDFLVGAPSDGVGGSGPGAAYLIFGPVSGATELTADATGMFSGEAEGDATGRGIAGLGDTNNDDYLDFLIGAYHNDTGGDNAGAAFLLSGNEL